jgi:hypothetical protein
MSEYYELVSMGSTLHRSLPWMDANNSGLIVTNINVLTHGDQIYREVFLSSCRCDWGYCVRGLTLEILGAHRPFAGLVQSTI